jgi:polyisoprenoid-binding protein YceI
LSTTTLSLDAIPGGTYNVDPVHSGVGFEVRHMGIATVRGAFRKFQGTIDASGETPILQGTVQVASIDTGDPQRDGHLTSPEFFDAEKHPEIIFSSAAGEPLDGLVPRAVASLIAERGLYRGGPRLHFGGSPKGTDRT